MFAHNKNNIGLKHKIISQTIYCSRQTKARAGMQLWNQGPETIIIVNVHWDIFNMAYCCVWWRWFDDAFLMLIALCYHVASAGLRKLKKRREDMWSH